MDWGLFGALLSAVYPPLKDTIGYVAKRRGSFNVHYKEQLKKMITLTQEDLSRLKAEIEEIRKVCAELNLPTGERGAVPWHIPHDVNAYLTWRYRRASNKIQDLSEEFSTSIDGIIDVISCCAGIMGEPVKSAKQAGTVDQDPASTVASEPDWAKDLDRQHEDMREKLRMPSHYSIDDLTNAMEQFLDAARAAMQKLAHFA